MLIAPVLAITMALAVGGYALTIWLYQKRQAQRRSITATSAAASHRTSVMQSVPLEAAADAVQDASCHPPPVPVVVLDPDGRVTVAYLLRASNQSYLVTHTSKDDSRASLGDRSLSPPLSAAGPAASLPPAEQQRSADEQISGSDSSMSGGITAAGSGPGCGECNEDGAASAESGTEPDLEKGSTSEAEEVEGPATPVAAERRCGSTGADGLPAEEACMPVWAPACK